MNIGRERAHLSRCDHCGQKIAWSRDRRQWLALPPRIELAGGPIHRRLECAPGPDRHHDPRINIYARALARLGGTR